MIDKATDVDGNVNIRIPGTGTTIKLTPKTRRGLWIVLGVIAVVSVIGIIS